MNTPLPSDGNKDIIPCVFKSKKGNEMKKVLFALLAVFSVAQLHAGLDGYFQLAVFSPGELPAPSYTIRGARLSLIYGECHEFYGFDVSMVGSVRERMCGAQTGVLWNDVGTDAYGLQIGCVNNVEGMFSGVQIGLVNAATDFYGYQVGLYNYAWNSAYGVQWGLFNWAENLYGWQVGLVNSHTSRSWYVWPLINFGW